MLHDHPRPPEACSSRKLSIHHAIKKRMPPKAWPSIGGCPLPSPHFPVLRQALPWLLASERNRESALNPRPPGGALAERALPEWGDQGLRLGLPETARRVHKPHWRRVTDLTYARRVDA